MGVKAGGWFACGWQVKLFDPIVTHGPYLSTLEIRSLYIKRYINSAVYIVSRIMRPSDFYTINGQLHYITLHYLCKLTRWLLMSMLLWWLVWSSTAVSGAVKTYSWLARSQSHWHGDRAWLTCEGNLFTWYIVIIIMPSSVKVLGAKTKITKLW